MEPVRFVLNDRPVVLEGISTTTTLLRWLRDQQRLTGTKEGCAEGDCGACMVVWVDDSADGKPIFRAVNSCLMLMPMVHGRRIYTVEGLQRNGELHPVQTVMVQKLGSQCGYCTPGFVMSLFEAYYRPDLSTGPSWQLDDQLAGNLCRCTGYRPIREAAEMVVGTGPIDEFSQQLTVPRLSNAIAYTCDEQQYVAPKALNELIQYISRFPTARIVAGATDIALDVTKRHIQFDKFVSVEAVPELRKIEKIDGGFRYGAAVLLADLETHEQAASPIRRMLRYFAARPIKNRGTLGGNLCNASPIGDLPPVMLALNATAIVASVRGIRRISIDDFFISYRKTVLAEDELLVSIEVPDLPSNTRSGAYKVSRRRELDISAIAAAFCVQVCNDKVISARLAFGGVAATPKRALNAESVFLQGSWDEATVRQAMDALGEDFSPIDDHRGTADWRRSLMRNVLYGFWLETKDGLTRDWVSQHSGTIVLGEAL